MNFKKIYKIWKSVSEFCENSFISSLDNSKNCKNNGKLCSFKNCPLELECYINKEDLKL